MPHSSITSQKAVFNAVKHGEAKTVEVSLVRTDGQVTLTIRNGGWGFDMRRDETQALNGMGLRLMAYRARLVGIKFDITPQVGEGATVTCMFETP